MKLNTDSDWLCVRFRSRSIPGAVSHIFRNWSTPAPEISFKVFLRLEDTNRNAWTRVIDRSLILFPRYDCAVSFFEITWHCTNRTKKLCNEWILSALFPDLQFLDFLKYYSRQTIGLLTMYHYGTLCLSTGVAQWQYGMCVYPLYTDSMRICISAAYWKSMCAS